MNQYANMIRSLKSPEGMQRLMHLYGNRDGMLVEQTARYTGILKRHEELFHETEQEVMLISAPGRTEIGGNHTDHNSGRVLAAAVNLDTLSEVSARNDMEVNVYSDGYAPLKLDLNNLEVVESEKGTTAALIRGVAARMKELGYKIGGFNAAVTSSVASGSGLSSSAAFEVMVCAILDQLYNGFSIDFITRAKISQYAENVFFGKPCGLMDQTACAVGGFVAIDFADPAAPVIEKLDLDIGSAGYCLCIVNTGGNHSDLNEDYASVPAEMKSVAAHFGKSVLRGRSYADVLAELPALRESVGDRALMRALHFIEENDRVAAQKKAIENGDMEAFLAGVLASGDSSFKQLQNVYTVKNVGEQGLSLALALCKHLLDGKGGAWRVHGGGFAGTVQAFVPLSLRDEFKRVMDGAFGENACSVLNIRPEGAIKLDI